MAIIVPFADPSAHGTLAKSVSFRRRFNYVVFQKRPVPVQPNTPEQLAQRLKFKQASFAWYSYDAESKKYFIRRAKDYNWTPRNLFIHAYLRGIMPSQINLSTGDMNNAQIQNLRSPEPQGLQWYFEQPFCGLGRIFDYENVYYDIAGGSPGRVIMMIWNSLGQDITLPFRDGIWTEFLIAGEWKNFIIRVPETEIKKDGHKDFFIGDDGSSYWDEECTQLAATNLF